jgi:hypothetical protein
MLKLARSTPLSSSECAKVRVLKSEEMEKDFPKALFKLMSVCVCRGATISTTIIMKFLFFVLGGEGGGGSSLTMRMPNTV